MRFGIQEMEVLLQFINKEKSNLTEEESPRIQQQSRPGIKGICNQEDRWLQETGISGEMELTAYMIV